MQVLTRQKCKAMMRMSRLAVSLPVSIKPGRCVQQAVQSSRVFSSFAPRKIKIETVLSPKFPVPTGPYSHAVKANGFVFITGQIATDETGKMMEGTVAQQIDQTCRNVQAVLEAAGSSLSKVIKVQLYFKNLRDLDREVNEVYYQYFSHKPVRTSVEVGGLMLDAGIEIEVVALQ